MKYIKTYVRVITEMTPEGKVIPRQLYWDDMLYDVDKIKQIRMAPAINSGGVGLRYMCRINGRDRYLYFEEDTHRWFVEQEIYDQGGNFQC